MELDQDQLEQFDTEGWVFLPDVFSQAEMDVLSGELPGIFAMDRDEVWREANGEAVRTAFAAHYYNEAFRRLGRHPRLIGPVKQLLDGDVYMHQYKINGKAAFDGDVWQWHQDYGTWARDDKMPEARAMNIALFIDEVTEFNGPLMMVPASHASLFMPEIPEYDTKITTYPHGRYPDVEWVKPVMLANGLLAPKGPAGSIIFMHLLTVHGSGPNMSPWHRSVMSLTLNSVENKAEGTVRGPAVCHDYTPIRSLPGSALLELTG